jgi:hypothetical protein
MVTTKNKTNHRGRLQSQGAQLELSQPWSQISPLTYLDALKLLTALSAQHNAAELNLRSYAFAAANRFITQAGQNGGVTGHIAKSFPVPQDQHARRVDIEVQKGDAFV